MYSLKLYNSPCQSMSVCPGYTYVIIVILCEHVSDLLCFAVSQAYLKTLDGNKARFHNYVLTIQEPKPRHAIPQPKTARFHNYILTIPQPHSGTIPQPKSQDSTTKFPWFHNQNLRIPQPNSHDSTTDISGFHNQNLAILQLTTIDSTRKTAATYFHCRKFVTSYKKLKSPTPRKTIDQI